MSACQLLAFAHSSPRGLLPRGALCIIQHGAGQRRLVMHTNPQNVVHYRGSTRRIPGCLPERVDADQI